MEYFFNCPYCWEHISMILDNSVEESEYIEDCEVCCRPVEIIYRFSGEDLVRFEARKIEGI